MERTVYINESVEIVSDGNTVWVNTFAGTIARFGPRGIDVHTSDTSGCLFCRAGKTDSKSWEEFRSAVRAHHHIEVPIEYRPDWLPELRW